MKRSELEAEYSYVVAARTDARRAEAREREAAIARSQAAALQDVAPAAEQLAGALGGKVRRKRKATTTTTTTKEA